jgi:hypothetical protein
MKLTGRFISGGFIGLLVAGAAQACPICILADPRTSGTYLKMTIMMSVLPLGVLGGLIIWLKRRYSPQPMRIARLMETQEAPELVAHQQV